MTLPKPPLPRNCSFSNSHSTRDCPGTPEMNETQGRGSSRSGWSTKCDGPSFPAFPLFFATSCWPFAKLPYMIEVKNECSRSWDADHRSLLTVFKQLRRRMIIKARIHTLRWESISCMNFFTTISHKLCLRAKLLLQNNSELLEFGMREKWVQPVRIQSCYLLEKEVSQIRRQWRRYFFHVSKANYISDSQRENK